MIDTVMQNILTLRASLAILHDNLIEHTDDHRYGELADELSDSVNEVLKKVRQIESDMSAMYEGIAIIEK